jgi:sugar transferase (PEP-CTERM system associated)
MIRIFGHFLPRSLLVLAVVEVGALFAAFHAGVRARFSFDPDSKRLDALSPLFPKAAIFVCVTMGAMTLVGLYSRQLRDAPEEILLKVFIAFVFSVVGMVLLFYLFPEDLFLGRGALGIVLIIAFFCVALVRVAFVKIADLEAIKRRVLILGTGDRAAAIKRLLRRRSDNRGITIVGFVRVPHEHSKVEGDIIEHDKPLVDLTRDYRVHEVVVAVDDRRKGLPLQEIVACRMAGTEIRDLPTFVERQCGKVLLDFLHPSWLIFSEGFNRGVLREVEKRLFDLSVSLLLILLTFPVMLLTAVAILVEDRGPILYRQRRVGEQGKTFNLLKFRSMTVDAEAADGPQWASRNDPRVTRVGAIIRKYRIDELPQLFNVIRGHMSFVGPRPERPEFVAELSKNIPYYSERHLVKPGITGWAQISYPYGASEKDAKEKLQYDLYYVKNYSLFLDIVILMQTAQVILWKKGAR